MSQNKDEGIILKYRKRILRENDIIDIRQLIINNPTASRRRLSKLLCELWDWRQENGALKDMVCRSLMLILHRAGHIQMPDVKVIMRNPIVERHRPKVLDDSFDRTAITTSVKQVSSALEMFQVRKSGLESTFNSLIQTHHYLGYSNPIGEHIKYLFMLNDRPIACALWMSTALKLKPRDDYIGWDAAAREKNIRMIAYNSRFLILPWVNIKYLASHLLSKMSRQISEDWQNLYHHPIHLLETYIEPERFKGSCYRAANWKMVGLTKGQGLRDKTKNRSVKEMFVYPCSKRSLKLLCVGPE
jgi:hypothetical protein